MVFRRRFFDNAEIEEHFFAAFDKMINGIGADNELTNNGDHHGKNTVKERQYFIPKWVVGSGEYMMMTGKLR